MNGHIFAYSGSGNTLLACEAIRTRVTSVDFNIVDLLSNPAHDPSNAGFVGFATWADFWDPPQRMKTFMESLQPVDGTPAFVFNTYGAMSGRTLATLHRWAHAKGFRVVAGHSLHAPESFPPMIKRGQGFADAPNEKELAAFESFASTLDEIGRVLSGGGCPPIVGAGLARFVPAFSRTHSRRAMGEKHVDEEACTECGTCRDRCPYGAIELTPKPVFDQERCYGCWACYNHCPTNAIYTAKIRGVTQYAGPSGGLRGKLVR